jgi:hypothetical protein
MRRSAARLALLIAATVAIGCTPENATPPQQPTTFDAAPPVAKSGGPQPAVKKKKEPGLGNATPRTSRKPPASL